MSNDNSFAAAGRFTRPHTPTRFQVFEPFCFIFPVRQAALEGIAPRLVPADDNPPLDAG
jgi:hypothetical protein